MLCKFQVSSKVIQLYVYMYLYLFFFKFSSHLGCYIILNRVPCSNSRFLLDIYFKYGSVDLSIPNSRTIPLPRPSPLVIISLWVCFCFVNKFICIFFFLIQNITTSSLSIHLLMDIRLLFCLNYCKQCCNERCGACILSDHVFLQIYDQEWDCRVIR